MNKLTNEKEKNKEVKDDDVIQENDAIKEALSGLGWEEEEKEGKSIEQLTEQAQIIEKLNKKILELQKKNQDLDALIKGNDQIREVEQIQSEYTKKIALLQERIDVMKGEKDEFMFKLGNAMKEKKELVRTYDLQVEQLNAQNQALLNRTALNQSFDDEIAVISAEKQELIRENTHLREKNTIDASKIKELENLNAQYHGELNNIKSEITQKNTKFTSLVQELEGYKNEFVNLKNRIVELEARNQSLSDELSQKQFQLSELSSHSASHQEEIANKDAIIKDLQNQISEYSEQIQYMEADSVNRSEFEELKKIIANKDQVITTKEKTIFELEKKNKELHAFAEEQETKVQEQNKKLTDIEGANSEVGELKEEIKTLNNMVMEQDHQKQVLYDQVKKLKEKETGDHAIIQRLEQQIEDMRSSVIKENLELDALRSQKRDYEGEIKEFEESIENKDKLVAKINRRLTEMKESHEKEINALHEDINEHKKRIKILRRDLSKKR